MSKSNELIIANNQTKGSSGSDIKELHSYLSFFGYLPLEYSKRELFDDSTAKALALYQKRHGLPETGILDQVTADMLNQPRCGVPDIAPRGYFSIGANFVLIGCSYQAQIRTLSYAFTNSTGDIPGDNERDAIRRAMATWETATNVSFVEVQPNTNPDLTYSWHTGDHGDGASFDGPGNTLAHAFYPPSCGGRHAGTCHFDEDERWNIGHVAGRFDLETVALHEIGHLLGLAHSTVAGSVMFPNYGGERRSLTADDLAGIETIYGKKGLSLRVLVHLQNIGDAYYIDNEFAGTRGQSRRLEGFQIEISSAIPDLSIEYMAHLQNIGDTGWVPEGQFIGTRGQSRRLEGFAVRLTGANAANYDVIYMAHLQNLADTAYFRNGEFCGTRGQSRRLEGLLIRIQPK